MSNCYMLQKHCCIKQTLIYWNPMDVNWSFDWAALSNISSHEVIATVAPSTSFNSYQKEKRKELPDRTIYDVKASKSTEPTLLNFIKFVVYYPELWNIRSACNCFAAGSTLRKGGQKATIRRRRRRKRNMPGCLNDFFFLGGKNTGTHTST